MTTRTAALDARIAPLEDELAQVRTAKNEAARTLASNPDAINPLRVAAKREAELEEEIALLNSARNVAKADDQEEETRERRQETARTFEQAKKLLVKRAAAAKKLDAAFAALADEVRAWIATNEEVRTVCLQVHQFAGRTTPRHPGRDPVPAWYRAAALGNPINAIAQDFASQVDWASQGLELKSHLAFQYSRRNPNEPNYILYEVAKNNDRIVAEMQRSLELAGVDAVPGKARNADDLVT